MTRDVPRLGGFYLQLRFLCGDRHPFQYRVTLDGRLSASATKGLLSPPSRRSNVCLTGTPRPFADGRETVFCRPPWPRLRFKPAGHRPHLAGNAFRCIRWQDGAKYGTV